MALSTFTMLCSQPSISRMFSSSETETLYPLCIILTYSLNPYYLRHLSIVFTCLSSNLLISDLLLWRMWTVQFQKLGKQEKKGIFPSSLTDWVRSMRFIPNTKSNSCLSLHIRVPLSWDGYSNLPSSLYRPCLSV